METNTSLTLMSKRWRSCTIVSLLGFFMLILCIKYQYNISPSRSAFQSIRSMAETTTTTTTTISIEKPKVFVITGSNTTTTTNAYYNNDDEHQNISNDNGELWMNESKKECNIFDGKWVYDPNAGPFYNGSQCPFLSDQVSCRKNGRLDFDYENWRWEAKDCEIPRLNGKMMLERIRGKRVVIIGDSLNRNQWESLSCLLYSAIPSKRALVDIGNGHHMIFKAKNYNCSVEFFWSPFLVQLDKTHSNSLRLLNLDKLSESSTQWRGADVMVFNTGHWWTHQGKLQAWDFFEHEGMLVQNLTVEIAFEIAIKTWAYWIDLNVDPTKTTVFFRSISPGHKGNQWCYNQTQPIKDDSYKLLFPRSIIEIVEKTITEMRTPVKYLNITKLSQYRKDAHPTVYTSKQGKLLTKDQRQKPDLYADCNHWCLPGLPDTWNSLLFTSISVDSSREVL